MKTANSPKNLKDMMKASTLTDAEFLQDRHVGLGSSVLFGWNEAAYCRIPSNIVLCSFGLVRMMFRSIPVFEAQSSRQARPLASVVLNSVANVIGTHFAQPRFLMDGYLDEERVRTMLADMKNLCTIRTRDLKNLLRLTKDITVSRNIEEARKLILDEYRDPKTAPGEVRRLWNGIISELGFYRPSPTYEHCKQYLNHTADLLRMRQLELQAKALEDSFASRSTPAEAVRELSNKPLPDFEIKTVEYEFKVKTAAHGRPISETYSEAENKLTINCYHREDGSISTVFAEVLRDGFANLMPYLKIVYSKAETPNDAQNNCKFLWNNQLVHECRADTVAEGIKLCRDAAAWHWINKFFDLDRINSPSPSVADASTQSGIMNSAVMDSERTESGMPKPFPEELKNVVQKLEKAGFRRCVDGLMTFREARDHWDLILKYRRYRNQ